MDHQRSCLQQLCLADHDYFPCQVSIAVRVKASDDAIAQVFWIIDQLEAKHLAEPECAGCLLGNLIVDLVERDPSFREQLIKVFDQWQGVFARSLRMGQSQLQPDVDPDLLAEELLTLIEGVLLMGRLYDQPERLKRGFNAARRLLNRALIER